MKIIKNHIEIHNRTSIDNYENILYLFDYIKMLNTCIHSVFLRNLCICIMFVLVLHIKRVPDVKDVYLASLFSLSILNLSHLYYFQASLIHLINAKSWWSDTLHYGLYLTHSHWLLKMVSLSNAREVPFNLNAWCEMYQIHLLRHDQNVLTGLDQSHWQIKHCDQWFMSKPLFYKRTALLVNGHCYFIADSSTDSFVIVSLIIFNKIESQQWQTTLTNQLVATMLYLSNSADAFNTNTFS